MIGWRFLVGYHPRSKDRMEADKTTGRQIIELQTSIGLLTAADANNYISSAMDAYGRQPFHHPATENVEVLTGGAKQFLLNHKEMSGIAERYGLPEVVRWQPKDVRAHAPAIEQSAANTYFPGP